MSSKSLSFEELTTLFSRVETVLNSRPLCSLSTDPYEFETLTLGHSLLIGLEGLTIPEYQLKDEPVNQISANQFDKFRNSSGICEEKHTFILSKIVKSGSITGGIFLSTSLSWFILMRHPYSGIHLVRLVPKGENLRVLLLNWSNVRKYTYIHWYQLIQI